MIGRMAVTKENNIIVGPVESTEIREFNDVWELKTELDKYELIICAGVMNTIFTGARCIDLIMSLYEHPEELFVPSLNVKYYSEVNRNNGYKNVFYGGNKEVTIWDKDSIRLWSTGHLNKLARKIMEALIDYTKTSYTGSEYEDIMSEARDNLDTALKRVMEIERDENVYDSDTNSWKEYSLEYLKNNPELFKEYTKALYYGRNVKLGQILTAGIGIDGGLNISREKNKNIFAGVNKKEFYVINLYGFRNRLRLDMGDISLREFIKNVANKEVKYALKFIIEHQDSKFWIESDKLWKKVTDSSKSMRGLSTDRDRQRYIDAQCGVIEYIKEKIDKAYIYEVSTDSMAFAFSRSIEPKLAIDVVIEAVLKHMPNTFEIISIDNRNRSINGAIRYWDEYTANAIQLELLNGIKLADIKNDISIGNIFNRIKIAKGVIE